MNKILLTLVLGMFLISLGSAETEIYKVNTPTNLQFTCTLNNAIPSDSATFNISITDRNGNYLIDNQLTQAQGNGAFNYTTTFPQTEIYKVQMFCTDGTYSYSGEGYYDVSAIGKELTPAKATSYLLIFILSFLIFIGLIIFGIFLPSGNKKDEMTGYIFAISNLKYLKLLSLSFSYLTAVFISYFSWMVAYAYLDMNFVTKIFQFIFWFLVALILPLFILMVYLLITNLIRDTKVKDLLLRGLRVNG